MKKARSIILTFVLYLCLVPLLLWGEKYGEVKNIPEQGVSAAQEVEEAKVFASEEGQEFDNEPEPESEEDVVEKILRRDSRSQRPLTASAAPPAGEIKSYKTVINRRIQHQGTLTGEALPSVQNHVGPEIYTFPMPDRAFFERFLRSFLRPERKKTMQTILDKAVMYRSYIAARVSEKDLPYELLFLPVIESSFVIKAVSNVGARGLWQFMPGTARHFDLVIDDWVDERQDFWKSTIAALTKLKTDKEFLGDWYLALAAYHCGTGRVLQAIKMSKNGCRDYWELSARGLLPKSTTYYVPSFLAASKIAAYPGRYGFTLSWEKSPEWQTIELDRMVDLEILANLTGIPLDLLQAGNAELKAYFTPPTMSRYALKVPAPYVEKVQTCLQDARINLIKYHYHVIRSGDTIYGLAKRYGIKEELIRKANPQVAAKALRIGSTLKIPVPEGTKIAVTTPQKKAPGSGLPFTHEYTVSRGDTLWSIARLFGISLEELVAKNNIGTDNIIRVGQKLKVPPVLQQGHTSASQG